ncbi:cytidine deaminase [Candidatus Gottesmanbacteria bacterium]|nr:cytidine deaminase [Candidatus Gottesmanbacteria bacterium]
MGEVFGGSGRMVQTDTVKKYQQLVTEAIKALENAYVPDPKGWRFGSAVLTAKGNIYSSGQYYSDTYSLTLHAEQAAIAHASAHGEHEIVAIAGVGTDKPEAYCHPCGMCKQLLYEKFLRHKIDIDVVMANTKGKYIVKKISELVPYPWPER